jgi:hypothetical protein
MTDGPSNKRVEEEIERVAKNLLEDLPDDVADRVKNLKITPHEVTYEYHSQEDGFDRLNSFKFNPSRFFDGDKQ